MSATKRKGIGKSQRFRIFTRDQFTCRYCGEQPPKVKLQVDHIIPVSKGGTNDDGNLLAACEACNAGKSDRPLDTIAPTSGEAAKIAQEHLEQIDAAELAAMAAKARKDARQVYIDYWCEQFGVHEVLNRITTRLMTLGDEFGPSQVMEWIDIAAHQTYGKESAGIKYVNACARNNRDGGEA